MLNSPRRLKHLKRSNRRACAAGILRILVWGQAINDDNVPWSGSERISNEENLEEIIMLGLRIREGLDLSRLGNMVDMARIQPMEDEGLIVIRDGRVIPTRTGRLLNDTVIERFFDACSL